MARLIDADRYAEVLARYINAPHVKVFGKYSDGMQIAISTCAELLNAQRTVDAVPVVRCKDCWKSAEGLCSYQLKNVPGKDFCGDGERKDNG